MPLPEILLYLASAICLASGITKILRARRRERDVRSFQSLARRHAAHVRDGRRFQ